MKNWLNGIWTKTIRLCKVMAINKTSETEFSTVENEPSFIVKYLTRPQLDYPNFYIRYSHDIANVLGLRICGAHVKGDEVAWKKHLIVVNILVVFSPIILRLVYSSAGLNDTMAWTVYFVGLTVVCQLFSFSGVHVFHRLTPQLEKCLTNKGMEYYKRWCSYSTALVPQLLATVFFVILAAWLLNGIASKPIMQGGVDLIFWLAYITSAVYLSGGVWWIIAGAILSWVISRPGCMKLFHPAPAFTPGVEELIRCYRMAFAGASLGCFSCLLPWLAWKKTSARAFLVQVQLCIYVFLLLFR